MNKCIKVNEKEYKLCIQSTKLSFNADLGYLNGQSYLPLSDKPQINYITLVGNKTGEELGLQETIYDITEQDIDNIIYGG